MAAQVFSGSPFNAFGKRGSNALSPAEPGGCQAMSPCGTPKRRRLQEVNAPLFDAPANPERDLVRSNKRGRVHDVNDENMDMPVYTQRYVSALEHTKLAELQQLREQFQRAMEEKDKELQEVRHQAVAQSHELQRVSGENKILKRAVQLQHQSVERVRELEEKHKSEIEAFVSAGIQASEHIRRIEQENYTLKAHLEQLAAPQRDEHVPRWGM